MLVGLFPPPVTGAAKNNAILADELGALGAEVRKIDLAAPTVSHVKSLRYHLTRLARNVAGWLQVLRLGGRKHTIYLVPDGGFGVWYTLAHVVAAVLRYGRLVLHHRTHLYIDRASPAMRAMVRLTGRRAHHVFLTDGMRFRFEELYGPVDGRVVSNARYVLAEASSAPGERGFQRQIVLGHLSNLCWAKGFFDAAEAFEGAIAQGLDVRLVLAGPVVERDVAIRLENLRSVHGARVQYCGPLSGDAKVKFYRELDLFLFPTRWPLEAAPNVLYEAFAAGVPCVSVGRGCISDMVYGVRGSLAQSVDGFADAVVSAISSIAAHHDTLPARRAEIRADVAREAVAADEAYRSLLTCLLR